jgi:hypothetical protein
MQASKTGTLQLTVGDHLDVRIQISSLVIAQCAERGHPL